MSSFVARTIRLHPDDDVVIARADLGSGEQILEEGLTANGRVPAGHKVATRAIRNGETVRKYNQPIGHAVAHIAAGDHVHVHNLAVGKFDADYAYCLDARPIEYVDRPATFQGIVRADGRVGTRNYLAVISTVNCSAHVARAIADHFDADQLSQYPNVDGVVAVHHKTGCGMSAEGAPMALLRRVLAGYARHPNVHSSLLVGLGCEANQIDALLESEELVPSEQLHVFTIQQTGGTQASIEAGISRIEEMLVAANDVQRESSSVRHLVVGLECGGSDGYSGVSANPALGVAVDLLVQHGGTAILSETPEVYGAEHLLTRRATTQQVGEKLIARIRWWETYVERLGGEMNNNPTPGNKAGGLTTILEKSLGAIAKGGTQPLMDVYEYAQTVTSHGLVFMDTPGFDPVSVTGHVAGGANMICFTTGRGSAFGSKPSPSLKLATNSALYERQPDDLDLNCGVIVDGTASVEEIGRQIFCLIVDTASGSRTKSELLNYGDDEIAPWMLGPTM